MQTSLPSEIRFFTVFPLVLSIAATCFGPATFCQETSDPEKFFGDYTLNDLKELNADLIEMLNDVVLVDMKGDSKNVEQFVKEIQTQCPVHLNILVMEEAKSINLPAIKLSKVSAGAAINAISIATDGLVALEYDESGQIGYIGRKKGFIPSSEVSVINLSDVLSVHSNESFLSAVEIGMEMMGSKNSGVQMKLHEETKILFLRGTPEEIHLIEQLVSQLMRGHHGGAASGGGRGVRSIKGGGAGGGAGGGGFPEK